MVPEQHMNRTKALQQTKNTQITHGQCISIHIVNMVNTLFPTTEQNITFKVGEICHQVLCKIQLFLQCSTIKTLKRLLCFTLIAVTVDFMVEYHSNFFHNTSPKLDVTATQGVNSVTVRGDSL